MASMDLKTGNKVEGQGQAPNVSMPMGGDKMEQVRLCATGLWTAISLAGLGLVCVSKRGRADGEARGGGANGVEIIFDS